MKTSEVHLPSKAAEKDPQVSQPLLSALVLAIISDRAAQDAADPDEHKLSTHKLPSLPFSLKAPLPPRAEETRSLRELIKHELTAPTLGAGVNPLLIKILAKGTLLTGLGLTAIDAMLGTGLITQAQGVGLMSISIAADAMANVVGQNHKLTPRGVTNYAISIGASHAVYPIVGFAAALSVGAVLNAGAVLAGNAGADPVFMQSLAQGLVATCVYGFGSLLLFRFLKADMIPDFAGKDKESEEKVQKPEPKSIFGKLIRGISKKIESAYEGSMERLEARILDTTQSGIASFNTMDRDLKSFVKSLRHPDTVRCSIDAFVSTFAKTAYIAGTGFLAQSEAIGLTSLGVFCLVLAAGVGSSFGFKLLEKATKRAVSQNTKKTKTGVKDRFFSYVQKHAFGLNHKINAAFKVVALGTLGYFACSAGAEAAVELGQATSAMTPEIAGSVKSWLTTAFGALYATSMIGWSNLKGIWESSREEAQEVVSAFESNIK